MFAAAVEEDGVEHKLTHHPVRVYSPSGFPVENPSSKEAARDKQHLLQCKQQLQQELHGQLSAKRQSESQLLQSRRASQQPYPPAPGSFSNLHAIRTEPVAVSKGFSKGSQLAATSLLSSTYQGTAAVSSASLHLASPTSLAATASPMSVPDCLGAPTPQKAFSRTTVSRFPPSIPTAVSSTGSVASANAARPLVRQSLSLTALNTHDRPPPPPKEPVSTSLIGLRASKGAKPPPVSSSLAGANLKGESPGPAHAPAVRPNCPTIQAAPQDKLGSQPGPTSAKRTSSAAALGNSLGSNTRERSCASEESSVGATPGRIPAPGGYGRPDARLDPNWRPLDNGIPGPPAPAGDFCRSTPSASSSSFAFSPNGREGPSQCELPRWKALTSDSESLSLARRLAVLTPAHPWGQDLGAGLLLRGLQLIFDDLRRPRPDLDAATLRVMTWDFERRRGVLPAGWQANPALSARCSQHLAMLLLSEEHGEAVRVPVVAGISLPIQLSELEREETSRAVWTALFEGCEELVQRARTLWPSRLGIADELFRLADPYRRGKLSSALGEVEHYVDLVFQALQLQAPRCPAAVWYQLVCACSDDAARELTQSQAEDLVQWLLECIASSLTDDASRLHLRLEDESPTRRPEMDSTGSSPLDRSHQSIARTVESVSPAPSAVLVLRLGQGQKGAPEGPGGQLAPILSSREEEELSDWQSLGGGGAKGLTELGLSEASHITPSPSAPSPAEEDLDPRVVQRRPIGRGGGESPSQSSGQVSRRAMQEVVSFADEFEVEAPLPAPRHRSSRSASRTPSPDKRKGGGDRQQNFVDRVSSAAASADSSPTRDSPTAIKQPPGKAGSRRAPTAALDARSGGSRAASRTPSPDKKKGGSDKQQSFVDRVSSTATISIDNSPTRDSPPTVKQPFGQADWPGPSTQTVDSASQAVTPKAGTGAFARRDVAPLAGRTFPKGLSALSASEEDDEMAGLQLGT